MSHGTATAAGRRPRPPVLYDVVERGHRAPAPTVLRYRPSPALREWLASHVSAALAVALTRRPTRTAVPAGRHYHAGTPFAARRR
ncbi:hypothetical protein KBTX_01772 [wastewater metagenome]|uniref:Uncharacterized protein n=2 Tax=unclassified sequences TaxID=12908 RepID=A0A5B8R8J3_9ZZZZ|nr:hypothetical protein KBTEX_01772 [uncultured organism]